MHGGDYINSGNGNDVVRGGHGHDFLYGGAGADWIWGGTGRNLMQGGLIDDGVDQLYVPADSVRNSNGNPGGVNADILSYVDTNDQIFIHGVEDSTLSFVEDVTHPQSNWTTPAPQVSDSYRTYTGSYTGVGIYANGVLEAIVVSGYNVPSTASDVDAITTGGFF